jgi:hypothetical protein
MAAVPVERGSEADGATSHGMCPSCEPAVVTRTRKELGLVTHCEACSHPLNLDGVCPTCHVGHDGDPCFECGRFGYHRDACPSMKGVAR